MKNKNYINHYSYNKDEDDERMTLNSIGFGHSDIYIYYIIEGDENRFVSMLLRYCLDPSSIYLFLLRLVSLKWTESCDSPI